ncbi:MinD/ParA family ATP-binding protein [Nocardia heshunensis]
MSRENDGLPMLPPWLAEGEVSDTAYEPAPVQNLPQDEVIPKAKGRIFGNRERRKKSSTPEPAPQSKSPTPTPAPDRSTPPAPKSAEPDRSASQQPSAPMPQRAPGTHFNLPSQGTPQNGATPQSAAPNGQPPATPRPNGQGFPTQQPDNQGFPHQQPNGQGFQGQQPNNQGFPAQQPNSQGFPAAQPNGTGFPPARPNRSNAGGAVPNGQAEQRLPDQPPATAQPPRQVPQSSPLSPTDLAENGGQFSRPPMNPEPAQPSPHSGPLGPTATPAVGGGHFSQPPVVPESPLLGPNSGAAGPRLSGPAVPEVPADQSAHSRPQPSNSGFTPPLLPPSPIPQPDSATVQSGDASRAAGPSAIAPAHVAPSDPTTRVPLPHAPGESGSAATDSATLSGRPPLPPSPGEVGATTPDPVGTTTKISQPPLPPAPGDLDATGTGIITPPAGTPAVSGDAFAPVPNTTAAAHSLLNAQLANLGGALAGPNPQAPTADGGAPTGAPDRPVDTDSGAHRHGIDSPAIEDATVDRSNHATELEQPIPPGRHRAVEVPLPLPSDPRQHSPIPQDDSAQPAFRPPAPPIPQGSGPAPLNSGSQIPGPGPQSSVPAQQFPGAGPQTSGPVPQVPGPGPQGSGPIPQVPNSGAQAPVGGYWTPPQPPVPGVAQGQQSPVPNAPESAPAPVATNPGYPAGPVQQQPNPFAPDAAQEAADPDANPWANAPMSEAAAAGLTGPHGVGTAPNGMGMPGNMAPGQSNWGSETPGQQVPGGAGAPWGGPGQQQMPWNGSGQQQGAPYQGAQDGSGATGQDGSGSGQGVVGGPGQMPWAAPGQQSAPGYPSGEVGQAPWGAPGSEQQAGYPGGAVAPSNFAPGQYGPGAQSGPATGQYGPGPQGQSGYGAQAWGANGPGGTAPSLDDVPFRKAKKAPDSGWRRAVHHMSGGAINPGMSAEERRLQELVARIRQPVRGDYRIAVLSLKGGVGKTTTTMGLGSIFSSIRGDRVIAVDANPDFGTLSQRVPLQTRSTVRDLLLDEHIQRYSDVRRHTSQGSSRLEVLASERDPAASEAFSEDEYRAVARILQRFYNIILTDCGTGLMHSAMAGVLDLAHSLVLISSSAIDGARSAAATLDWLSLHGHDHLVRNAVVVINLPRPGAPSVGINQLRDYFLSRCRAVHIIPYDSHLGEGAEIDLHRLSKPTKRAYVELAATVADDFSADHRRYRG